MGSAEGILLSFLQVLWKRGEIGLDFHSFLITLVPNRKHPVGLKDFRPISLSGAQYKVLAKVLAKRLKKVIPLLISDTQSRFKKGR